MIGGQPLDPRSSLRLWQWSSLAHTSFAILCYTERMTAIRDRTAGEGSVDPKTLTANPKNWRLHPDNQDAALGGILSDVGWVQRVIVNRNTGFVVDGHLRIKHAIAHNVQSIPVQYVDLSPEEESLVLATFDPITAMADANQEMLMELINSVDAASDEVEELLARIASDVAGAEEAGDQGDGNYSRKIIAPIYEIKGEIPSITEMIDRTKTTALVAEIDGANLPDEVSGFLIAAAERHTVFRFDRIAEYYAHAPADVQNLMERSALVIVDFNRAIEDGYVSMSEEMLQQVTGDEVSDDAE